MGVGVGVGVGERKSMRYEMERVLIAYCALHMDARMSDMK